MKLAEYMEQSQKDDAEMAASLGVDRTTVMRLRTGRNRPSWAVADRLVEVTQGAVTPNDFVMPSQESEDAE